MAFETINKLLFAKRHSEWFAARDFFDQLGTPNHDVTEDRAGVEQTDQKFKQFRISQQGFEEKAADSVSVHEPDEPVQSGIRVGNTAAPAQQFGLKLCVKLACSRSNMNVGRSFPESAESFGSAIGIIKAIEGRLLPYVILCFGLEQPIENRAHRGGVGAKRLGEWFYGWIAERPGDRQPGFAPRGKGVNLLLVLNLQTMFDRAQKDIGAPQRVKIF